MVWKVSILHALLSSQMWSAIEAEKSTSDRPGWRAASARRMSVSRSSSRTP
jgi:hypothetical protein